MKRTSSWLAIILLPVVVNGCIYALRRDLALRNYEWPTQMQYSPAYHSQTPNPVLPNGMTGQAPVPATIPRGFRPFHYGLGEAEEARAGRELVNPFQPTPEHLARGAQVYANHCAVCHGATGAGDGPIVPKFPNPPAYTAEQSKNRLDGTLFHVITLGRKDMPAQAAKVSADDRWKVILYIRKLQGKISG
jgi:mono/diheme cytochrome c family protein